jgi:hypothetical protein
MHGLAAYSQCIGIAQRNELRVTLVVVRCPFEEFKAPNKEGSEPDAVFHLVGGEAFAPTTAPGFRQVRKRTLRDLQSLELPEQRFTGRRREAVAGPRRIDQTLAVVVTEHERIEWSGRRPCIRR